MQNKYNIPLSLILICTLISCANKQPSSKGEQAKWSVQMANSIMHTSNTLLYFEKINNPAREYRIGDWDYDVGYMGSAIARLEDIDPKYSKYLKDYINYFILDDGTVKDYHLEEYNIDRVNPAKNLFSLYRKTGDEKYKIAIEQFVDQMRTHPKTTDGGYWHKNIYPHQMWLDGIYMASPFLAQYAKEFDHPEWFDVVTHQILLVYDKTYDPKTGLLFHAQDESKQQKWADPETGRSSYFWGRAIGWYLMAIVDVLDYLPQDNPQRNRIIEIFQQTVDAVLKVRDSKSGVWYQILNLSDREGNYLEGSCSAMFTYAIAKGAKKGYLAPSYLKVANDCFDSVLKTFITEDEHGYLKMQNICGGAGLGGTPYRDGSFEYYVSEAIVVNDCKGVAPFIDAAVELDR
ncbi:glycoside hydrolase family 88/105 protein [Mangrovibacterium lignilyticum]|uniref:glycoside hydrolase family 88/105 protein n=1 Tax=Mangrovibacterium lignilyticum TaxID=2668052 RepID=UPI0013D0B25E|nr:glycoside hydrolase family 88 protein [Mangrovibacterium lignilyticum]